MAGAAPPPPTRLKRCIAAAVLAFDGIGAMIVGELAAEGGGVPIIIVGVFGVAGEAVTLTLNPNAPTALLFICEEDDGC